MTAKNTLQGVTIAREFTGCIILIMQRLHEDDLVGYLLGKEHWEVVAFPAIAEEEALFEWDTPFGPCRHKRQIGDVLHPARESLQTLEVLRQTLGFYHFAGQYQQNPVPLGGGMIKGNWFKTYDATTRPEAFDRVVQSWDTANKDSDFSDYSVCTTWGVKGKSYYLLHVLRKRLNYPELKRVVREQATAFNAKIVLIEDKASGTQLIQELRHQGFSMVKACKPELDKKSRMYAETAPIENGFVFLPAEARWLDDYRRELLSFPKGKYDDQVDSTSQALAWMNRASAGSGLMEFYRREVEKQAEAEARLYG